MLIIASIILLAVMPVIICTQLDVVRANGNNSVVYGVCAGIASRFGLTAAFVRICGLLLGLLSQTIPALMLGYILLSLILPKDEDPDDSLLN